jgi:hypothetical protein
LKSYEALSYVWGTSASAGVNSIRNVPIQCSNHELLITTNLEQAIKHIRSKLSPIFLWADAICINQEDRKEREHQVTLMNQVYQKAKRVYIWLGEKVLWPQDENLEEFSDARAQRAFGAVCEVVNDWRRRVSLPEDVSYSFDESDGGRWTQFSYFEEYPSSMRESKNHKSIVEALQRHYPPRLPAEGESHPVCYGNGLIHTLSLRHENDEY